MIKKGAVITIIFAVNTLVQLLNQVVITRLFGATLSLDIFLAAVALPTVLVTVLYGTVSDSFLPLFAHKNAQAPKSAHDFFVAHFFKLLGLTVIATIALILLSPFLSNLLYGNRGEVFVNQVSLQMQILFTSLPFAFVATLLGAYLYSTRNFTRFPLAQAIGNIINLGLIVALVSYLGVWSLVLAFVANIILQILFLKPSVIKGKIKLDASITPFILAWIPLIISTFASRSDTLLLRSFATNLPEGYLVYLNLTSRMFSTAAGVATIGIQILLLPHLVEHIAQKNYVRANKLVVKSKLVGIIVAISTALGVWIIGPYLIQLLFVGGKFSAQDAEIATLLLPIFLFPAIGWGVQSIFFQPLMAIRKYFHLAIINLIALAIGWGSGLVIQSIYGPFQGLTFGLIILVFSGIIGSEIAWQIYKSRLSSKS